MSEAENIDNKEFCTMAAVTVTGKGNISVKPDLIDLGLNILTKDKDCGNAMDKAGSALEELRSILESCGFERDDLKTSDFSVRTEYETVPDENGNYRNVFKGYCCTHALHVSFPMDTQRLADVLGRISSSEAAPEISVRFTVSDPESAREELINLSAADARKKAELLCKASGASLGKLLRISYDRHDVNTYSQTGYGMDINCLRASAKAVSIAPDDIKLTDSAEFEWEIN